MNYTVHHLKKYNLMNTTRYSSLIGSCLNNKNYISNLSNMAGSTQVTIISIKKILKIKILLILFLTFKLMIIRIIQISNSLISTHLPFKITIKLKMLKFSY